MDEFIRLLHSRSEQGTLTAKKKNKINKKPKYTDKNCKQQEEQEKSEEMLHFVFVLQ